MNTDKEEKIQRSLAVSWKEGIPAAVMQNIMDYYVVPFGLFLGASPQFIGFLVSLPHLTGSVIQLYAADIIRRSKSRLKFLVGQSWLQALMLLPMAVIALWNFSGRLTLLIFLVMFYRMVGNLIGTAWGSLVSDYLAPEARGWYLGWRSQVVGIAGVTGMATGGLLLFLMKGVHQGLGFALLFLGASICRFVSRHLMARMVDLPVHHEPGSDFTFFMFLRRFRRSNFVKYVLFVSGITFATNLAAPYFAVYMLRDLEFSYLTYTAIHMSAIMSSLISFPIWGRHADEVGNAKILKITGFFIPFIPFLWLVSKAPLYLVFVEMFAGFVWGGFNLCAANFIYDAVSPAKRIRCIGYFNLINGIAIFMGAALGGYGADRLPVLLGSPLLSLFVISGALRLVIFLVLFRHFKEVRAGARHVSSLNLFFSVAGIKPVVGRVNDWDGLTTGTKFSDKPKEPSAPSK